MIIHREQTSELGGHEARRFESRKNSAFTPRSTRAELYAMGEALRISGYLGESDTIDKATAAFSIAYADQVESDYDAVKKAAGKGLLEVLIERK